MVKAAAQRGRHSMRARVSPRPRPNKERSMKKAIVKAILAATLLATAAPMLSACNTFAGVGEDIQRGGAAIERQAERRN
jgi:predicted small secreted protein